MAAESIRPAAALAGGTAACWRFAAGLFRVGCVGQEGQEGQEQQQVGLGIWEKGRKGGRTLGTTALYVKVAWSRAVAIAGRAVSSPVHPASMLGSRAGRRPTHCTFHDIDSQQRAAAKNNVLTRGQQLRPRATHPGWPKWREWRERWTDRLTHASQIPVWLTGVGRLPCCPTVEAKGAVYRRQSRQESVTQPPIYLLYD